MLGYRVVRDSNEGKAIIYTGSTHSKDWMSQYEVVDMDEENYEDKITDIAENLERIGYRQLS